ncbi:MAG TPA: hypothetical protein PLZ55_17835, partial [bacterium]|nr:hypothetical protein [bacterium]
MRFFISIALLVLLVYGGTRLYRRTRGAKWLDHLFGTGFAFCLIGVLAGPSAAGLLSPTMLTELEPFVIFSLGWVGFLVGMQADLALLRQVPRCYFTFTFVESGLSIAAITLLCMLMFSQLGVSGYDLVLLSLLAGGCAGVSSQALPLLAGERMHKQESLFLRVITGLDDFPTMILVMVLFAYAGPGRILHTLWSGAFWLLVTVFLGMGFGLVFCTLLRARAKFDETLAICIGVTVLAAGAAAYLHLAVPGLGFLAGLIVANARLPKKQTFYSVLTTVEHPIVYLMLIIAGAHLRFDQSWWLIPLVAYVIVRGVAKVLSGRLTGMILGGDSGVSSRIGWGLIASGPLSVAVALDYHCVQHGPNSELLLWMVTTGAILGEMLVPWAVRRLGTEESSSG